MTTMTTYEYYGYLYDYDITTILDLDSHKNNVDFNTIVYGLL